MILILTEENVHFLISVLKMRTFLISVFNCEIGLCTTFLKKIKNFLTLYYSIHNTRQELKRAMKNSKLSVNESSDSDTLEVVKVTNNKRKRKQKVAVKSNKRAKKKI